MEIKVRVINGSSVKKEEVEKPKSTILTSNYIKKLNKQIEDNVRARENSRTPDPLTLERIIR